MPGGSEKKNKKHWLLAYDIAPVKGLKVKKYEGCVHIATIPSRKDYDWIKLYLFIFKPAINGSRSQHYYCGTAASQLRGPFVFSIANILVSYTFLLKLSCIFTRFKTLNVD